jgi:hypothetical protein
MNNNSATKTTHLAENRTNTGQKLTMSQLAQQQDNIAQVKLRPSQFVEERPRKSYHNDGPGGNYQGF